MEKVSLDSIVIYNNFFKSSLLKDYHNPKPFTYLIGSPIWADNDQNQNDLVLPIYIRATCSKTKDSKFIIYKCNWYDLKLTKIGCVPHKLMNVLVNSSNGILKPIVILLNLSSMFIPYSFIENLR